MSCGGLDNFLQRAGIIVKFKCICAECIGQDNIAARFHVTSVYPADFFRMSHIPQLGKFSGFQPLFLEQCSHSAVKKKQFFSKSFSYHSVFLIYPFCHVLFVVFCQLISGKDSPYFRRPRIPARGSVLLPG